MTYVITEPCIGVKDKACVGECPAGCIYEGERMLYICPASASTAAPASRCARPGRSSAKTTCPANGRSSPPRTPGSPASPDRPAAPL